MKKVIIVANVAKEHILKFHVPTIQMLKENGWHVDVACAGAEEVPYCDMQYHMIYKRNPVSFRTILGVAQLHKILKKGSYDVVYCHTPTGGVVSRLATIGLKNKPYMMYTAHGFHFFKGAALINWLVYFPIEWLLSYRTDRLIVVNQEDYNTAQKFHMGMKDLKIFHEMGVNKEKFTQNVDEETLSALRQEFGIKKGQTVLTYVAELIDNKNQTVLIQTLKLLLKQKRNVKLLLVGPEHDDGKYAEYAKKIGVSSRVIFTGWRSDIPAILGITDIYVASSLREGVGLNLVEAQYAGIPVVASDNRGHREVIEDGKNGYLVNPKDPYTYAKRISTLMDHPEIKDSFIAESAVTAEKFSVEHSMNSIKSYFEEF